MILQVLRPEAVQGHQDERRSAEAVWRGKRKKGAFSRRALVNGGTEQRLGGRRGYLWRRAVALCGENMAALRPDRRRANTPRRRTGGGMRLYGSARRLNPGARHTGPFHWEQDCLII